MGFALKQIKSIKPAYVKKLQDSEIFTTDDLLQKCANKETRELAATKSSISDIVLLDWARMSDFMRIKGVGEEYAELLQEAGYSCVHELKNRKPAKVLENIIEANEKFKIARFIPPKSIIQDWIEQAKELAPIEFTN